MASSPFFSTEHLAYRKVLDEFVAREITPYVNEWDEAGEFPRDLYRKAAEVGMLGVGFDEEYGGLGHHDALLLCVVSQAIARCGAGGVGAGLLSNYIGAPPIQVAGSDELKGEALPPVLSGEKIAALAITEPGGGSDVAAISTTAHRDGDEWIINGQKTFITSGMRADYITTAVRTGGEGMHGISLIVVPGDAPGLERTPLKKQGWWASDTAALYFDDCRVPAGNLLGIENEGFGIIMRNFNYERLFMIAGMVEGSRLCLEAAVDWAKERRTFGKRLIDHQVIRHKVAEMTRHIEATQAWMELLAWRVNQGDTPAGDLALAKVQASTTMEFCAREAMQIMGGAGFLRGHPVERLYREVRVNAIGGGSEEILRDLATRQMGL